MSRRVRMALFAASSLALAGLMVWGVAGLREFGEFEGQYGRILNASVQAERHVENVVSAATFDYRGFDTLGEEFILFASVMAVALLLREARDRERERPADPVRSDLVRLAGLLLVGPTVVVGLYVVAHGYLTPGGGFQGGVVLAGALILLWAGGRYTAYRAAAPHALVDAAEGVGAAAFASVGIAALASAAAFLENVLPLGTTGTLAAGGTIPLLNALAGLEVAAGVVLLFHEFLEEVYA